MARAVSYYLQSTSREAASIHLCNKDRASWLVARLGQETSEMLTPIRGRTPY